MQYFYYYGDDGGDDAYYDDAYLLLWWRKYRLGTKGCCSDTDWVEFEQWFEDEYSDYFKGCLLNYHEYSHKCFILRVVWFI